MPVKNKNFYDYKTATIASSGTKSGVIGLDGAKITGLIFPSAFTGATVSFEAAEDSGGTFKALKDDAGNTVSITASTNAVVGVTASATSMALAAVNFIKLVSASSEDAEREIIVLVKS